MAEIKNEAFDNVWGLYSNKSTRKRLQKYLPGVARILSSGNRMQAEQEFNAEMLSALNGTSLLSNELAWAAAGKIPSATMQDIFAADDEDSKGRKRATKTFLVKLGNAANSYFSQNSQAYNDAENFPKKVQSFIDQGYSENEAKMFAVPSAKFKDFNKKIDAKAQYKYSGKDNKVHSVSQDFHDRSVMPKDDEIVTGDLVEKQDQDKKTLSKIFGGALSEQVGDEKNLDNLEEYAKELGFVDSDALVDYLMQSYDRSKRIREQEDDGLATAAAKTLFAPWVNEKWDEGIPASTTDIVHDVALGAMEFAPQGKAVGTIGRVLKTAAPKTRAMANAEKIMTSPWVKYASRKASLPAEAAFLENVLNESQEGIDFGDIAKQTIGNSSLDIGLTSALKGITRLPLFSRLPANYIRGGFLETKKDIAKALEKRAYEMALESEAGQVAHNAMLRLNPDFRANPSIMYRSLSGNKNFNKKFPLGSESFDRVFNDAWNSAKHAGAEEVPTGKRSLKEALKSLDSYKKTKDFKTALEAAAWEKSGYKGKNLLNELRDDPYKFNIGLEEADAAKQAALTLLYNDYTKKRKGLDKVLGFLKYEGAPEAIRIGENVASVNRLYGPIYGRALGGFGLKKQVDSDK